MCVDCPNFALLGLFYCKNNVYNFFYSIYVIKPYFCIVLSQTGAKAQIKKNSTHGSVDMPYNFFKFK